MVSKIDQIYKTQPVGKDHLLPSCIGFGMLDARRTRIEPPEDKSGEPILNVSYVTREGDLVYKVRLEKEFCYVEEFFEGRLISGAKSTTLKKAFTQNFLCWSSNPRFRKMIDKIMRDRNVSLVRPGQYGFRSVFFPEGLIFFLRLPVVPYDRMAEIEPKLRDISSHVFIDGIYGGEVIASGQGLVTHYFARFIDFIATLWNLEETLDLIFEQGLVPLYPQMGLYILDPADAVPGSFKVYLGEEGTKMEAYGHLLDRPGDIDVIQAQELIMSGIHQMKRVKNGQPAQLN